MMQDTTIRIVAATAVAIAVAVGLVSAEAREPQWRKSRGLCRQLRAEGWKPSPEAPGDPATGELLHGSIFVCLLRQHLPARAGEKPAHIDVFMQHGGGDNLTIIADVWAAADRAATLAAVASTLGRVARELEIALPADMIEGIKSGERWSDEAEDLSFDIWKTSRESELIAQPDLKPGDVPLVAFKVSVEPTQ